VNIVAADTAIGDRHLESERQEACGTFLLVSHDRRLLQTVTITRRVELPGRHEASRGLRKS
jgi:ATPase subunit of ABC transporter with duplicated ATPase domains